MRKYDIYLIEEEFALHYFQKEHLMYQLFLEYKTFDVDHDIYRKKQVEYITKKIPLMQLQWMIDSRAGKDSRWTALQCGEYQYEKENSKAKLHLTPDCLFVEAEGTVEAETVFFEVLRKISPCFLAMNYEEHVYGWLNPVKQRKICIK